MKIAHLITDDREPTRSYERDMPWFGTAPEALLQGFAEMSDVEVHIVSCTQRPMKSPAKLAPNIFFHSLHVPKLGWLRTGYQGCIRAARRKLREIQPDIVHGQGSERDQNISAVFSGFPNVITIHGNMAALSRQFKAVPGTYLWLAGMLENISVPRAGGVLCNSAYTESLVRPRNARTWRVPNALRRAFFDTTPQGSPATVPRLVNVGVVCPRKRQVELLEMCGRLHREGLAFQMEFIGEVPAGNAYGQKFLQLIRTATEQGYAYHSGVKDVAALIAALDQAHGCVHFPNEEAFGLIVAESLARNLKFFGAREGGIVDIAESVEGAELFGTNDWPGLEEGIRRWLRTGAPRPANAVSVMAERYHPRVIAARHLEIYREVLGLPPHTGEAFSADAAERSKDKMSAVSYKFTLGDKIAGALEGLRMRFFPRRVLVAGPYVGEFGHELMEWQAWVRVQVPRYHEVHVITFPGREALYPGCHFHTHDIPLEKAGYRHGRLTPSELKAMARARAEEWGLKDYDILTAQHLCTRYHQRFILPAKFDLLRQPPLDGRLRDIAFHFRWVQKEGPDQTRNYPRELCDRVAALCRERGYSLCCVGHPLYSYCPPGVEDLRSDDLEKSITAISSARLLAGELSGPMHLAQLCGVPILIWADGQWRLDNSERWNVFHVPTFIVANDTHRPNVERVVETIDRAMRELSPAVDNAQARAKMHSA